MKLNNYFKISEAAEFLGVCRATLRNWDRDGKLKPQRTPSGFRVYTLQQLEAVLRGVRDSVQMVEKELDECRQGKIVREAIDLEKYDG